jgi:UDP-N-acetylglucosamine/UDP-N-acetylgalactosamine diphosphorylase
VTGPLATRLEGAGQGHLARALDRLEGAARARLLRQVEALDLDLVSRLVATYVRQEAESEAFGDLEPPEVIGRPRSPADEERDARARRAGEEHLRAGRVAVVLLAGGQGTRLGFAGPKGDFPLGPVTGRTLFQVHAAKVAAIRARYGCPLPFCVMTSPATDAATRESFERAGFFGLPRESVRFFVQGTLPAVDRQSGAILLDAPDRLSLSPDGHGGLLRALRREGVLDELAAAGIATLVTFQVDNPLLRLADPVYVGHHVLARSEMSSLVVHKTSPAERMGVLARAGGRTRLVEYSDLPGELADLRDPDGGLVFWAGNIAVHCLELDFVDRLTSGGLELPYHRAVKQVPFVDERGVRVEPREPNAVKFEAFIFDALPMAERTMTLEVAREEQFSPIKNADGDDSPATCRRDLMRLYARWLEAAGLAVPRDATGEPKYPIEIDPRRAMDAEDLRVRPPGPSTVEGPLVLAAS